MKQIKVEVKDEYMDEFIQKLMELRDAECKDDTRCITIFGLTLEEYQEHCLKKKD